MLTERREARLKGQVPGRHIAALLAKSAPQKKQQHVYTLLTFTRLYVASRNWDRTPLENLGLRLVQVGLRALIWGRTIAANKVVVMPMSWVARLGNSYVGSDHMGRDIRADIDAGGRDTDSLPTSRSHTNSIVTPMKATNSRSQGGGAMLDLQHGVRPMNVYPIIEAEMRSLRLTACISGISFPIGTAFAVYAMNVYMNSTVYDGLPTQARMLVDVVAQLCLVFACAAFAVGGFATLAGRKTWDKIKQSTA